MTKRKRRTNYEIRTQQNLCKLTAGWSSKQTLIANQVDLTVFLGSYHNWVQLLSSTPIVRVDVNQWFIEKWLTTKSVVCEVLANTSTRTNQHCVVNQLSTELHVSSLYTNI